jgi:DNA-binding transcriptional regulator YdaS (Cro superfamily)
MRAAANTMRRVKKTPKPEAPAPSPYSVALRSAIERKGVRHEELAAPLGVSPALVSAWVTGRKPVPATRAKPLADELGNVAPEAISRDYAAIAKQGANVAQMPGTPALHPALAQNRVENDIDSLRLALAVMVDVMRRHRPAEAADVLETIQRTVPRKFRDSGFLLELAEALGARSPSSAKGKAAARPRAKPRSA